jgi:ribosomal protein S18 acetylase RimI-like enzyme
MDENLKNVIWRALSGALAGFSTGTATARRFAPGYSPIAAFADPIHPDWDALAPYCTSGESIYSEGWPGPAPDGWRIEEEGEMHRMVWNGDLPGAPSDSAGVQRLEPEHAVQAFNLAMLTHPGPFGPRTLELGEYFGIFDGPDLVAMAGERFFDGQYREISGVCTHPDHSGRGHARRLVTHLIRRQRARGETPFLHVMTGNTRAGDLYRRLGFRVFSQPPVRVVARIPT